MIGIIALVAFGPSRLPELARTVGSLIGSLRKSSDSLRREFYNTVYRPAEEQSREFRQIGRELRAIKREVTTAATATQESGHHTGISASESSPEVAIAAEQHTSNGNAPLGEDGNQRIAAGSKQ